MNTTPYKGFNIEQTNGGNFAVLNGANPAEGFKLEGYASINAAKGAITKSLNATGYSDVSKAKAALTSNNDADKASVPADVTRLSSPIPTVFANLIAGDVFTSEKHPGYALVKNADNTASVPGTATSYEFNADAVVHLTHFNTVFPQMEAATVAALLVYYGMDKKRDTRSRNKREGGYAGKTWASKGEPAQHMRHAGRFSLKAKAKAKRNEK